MSMTFTGRRHLCHLDLDHLRPSDEASDICGQSAGRSVGSRYVTPLADLIPEAEEPEQSSYFKSDRSEGPVADVINLFFSDDCPKGLF